MLAVDQERGRIVKNKHTLVRPGVCLFQILPIFNTGSGLYDSDWRLRIRSALLCMLGKG